MDHLLSNKSQCPRETIRDRMNIVTDTAAGTASNRRACTFIELMAVLALICIVVLTLFSAQAGSRTKSQPIRCLDNMRQLMTAMMLYTHDNHDFLPPNPADVNAPAGYNWCSGLAGVGESAEFNTDPLKDPRRCLITSYINTNVALFRCTADTRKGPYNGSDPTQLGKIVPAARTISMSLAVGTVAPGGNSGVPNLPVSGLWLTGSYGQNQHDLPWRTYGRASEMVIPIPASLGVLLEEDPYSINDSSFAMSVGIAEWIDFPGDRLHNGAGVIGFGDGHSEFHKWQSQFTFLAGPPAIRSLPPTDADWNWLAARTSARAR